MPGMKTGVQSGAHVREWVQFGILIFATIWGAYTFVYKEHIEPELKPAALVVTGDLQETGRSEESLMIRARVHAVNKTDRPLYMPALWYTVWGVRLQPQGKPGPQFIHEG